MAREPNGRFSTADDMARVLLATARALAGAAPLPTAEFRSVEVARAAQASDPGHQTVGREGTHVSAQLPTGVNSPSVAPPSVQVVGESLSATMKSGQVPPIHVQQVIGVKPVFVAMIALACLVLGFAAGVGTTFLAFSL
jgi:hypothetical protein